MRSWAVRLLPAAALIGPAVLFSCTDSPTSPDAGARPHVESALPRLQKGVGQAPVVRGGGSVPTPSGSRLEPPRGKGGSFDRRVPEGASNQVAAAAAGHERHLILENSSDGSRALWVISNGAIVNSTSLGTVPPSWKIKGSGEYNADSYEDILWENTGPGGDGSRAVWLMDGAGRVLAAVSLGMVDVEWRIAGGGDYDNDGKDDILWENINTGSRVVWVMNGGQVTRAVVLGTLFDWHMVATPDLNSDGKADILLENTVNGNRALWVMSGGAVQSAVLLGNVSLDWHISAGTDVDDDGNTDILLENHADGARVVWLEDGQGRVTGAPLLTTLDPVWHIAAALKPVRTLSLRLVPFITSGLSSPIFMAQPLDDGRFFVLMQSGRIEVVRDGVMQTTSFLDIRSRVMAGGEAGTLSVVFHPQYATNRYFYVAFTALNGDIRIERFTTSANPEVADPTTSKLILAVPHPTYDMHYGGLLTFGPDGMFYAALGDGGGSGDPQGNAQDYNSLLGAMLRLDVDGGDPYAIPANNPFVGQAGRRGEIWAKGLRNPWRYSIDAPTGLLYIGDVGQSSFEEVDVEPYTSAGLDYGWNVMEGFNCYNATTCTQTGFTLPLLAYDHDEGCSVIGGYVYRGSAMPELTGNYLYSDYCGGWIRSFRYENGVAVNSKDWGLSTTQVRSFALDWSGEPYLITSTTIYKIVRAP